MTQQNNQSVYVKMPHTGMIPIINRKGPITVPPMLIAAWQATALKKMGFEVIVVNSAGQPINSAAPVPVVTVPHPVVEKVVPTKPVVATVEEPVTDVVDEVLTTVTEPDTEVTDNTVVSTDENHVTEPVDETTTEDPDMEPEQEETSEEVTEGEEEETIEDSDSPIFTEEDLEGKSKKELQMILTDRGYQVDLRANVNTLKEQIIQTNPET
jgi:hypothetical protein